MKLSSSIVFYFASGVVLAASFLYLVTSSKEMYPRSSIVPEFEPKYQIDLSSDKYRNMQEAMSKLESYRGVNKLSVNRESIIHNIEIKGSTFTLSVDGVHNMIALAVGDHNEYDFDIPILHTTLNATVISIHSSEQHPSIPSDLKQRWKEVIVDDVKSVSAVVSAIDKLIKENKYKIDTIFTDARNSQWDVLRELVSHYSLMVRQYVLMSPSQLKPVFKDVREMKGLFRQSGYTYSRIGSEPNVRVFLKE